MEDVVLLSRTAAEGCDSVIRRGMSLLLWAVYCECVNVGCVWMLLSKTMFALLPASNFKFSKCMCIQPKGLLLNIFGHHQWPAL